MLATRVSCLVILQTAVVPGAALPPALIPILPMVGYVPADHVVLGIHWVEGVAHEPAGWEILTAPKFLHDLIAKTEFPDLVFQALQLLTNLGTAKEEDKRGLVDEAYKEKTPEESAAFQKILNEISSAQKQIEQTGAKGTIALWVRPELVSGSMRRMSLEQGADLYMLRRTLEAKTEGASHDLLDDDEEEEEETAKPAEAKPEGQG